jgi:cytochrome c biogenesis protein CcmG/thiol:disulfide interchange protein DsbE
VLRAAAERYAGQVQFLGVVYHDEVEKIEAFLDAEGEWGPTLLDLDGSVAVAYGVYGAPETFFIDRDGVIVEKLTGTVPPASLFRKIESLL